MARVTRSSKHKSASTPTKPAQTDADTPIASIEAESVPRDKQSKGPYQRKPRKKRQRDARYKTKRRRQMEGGKKEMLAAPELPKAERETLRAGFRGNKTAQKLADAVLEQQVEIDSLRKQLSGDSKPSEDSAQAGSRQRPPKTIA